MITTVRGLPLGRHIKDAARLAEVGSVKLHGPLANRRVDVAEIDRIAELILGWCLGHVWFFRHSRAKVNQRLQAFAMLCGHHLG